jgi:diphthine synthase
MLYLIGLGLHSIQDMSLHSLEILKKADKIYAEFYTNAYNSEIPEIEKLSGKKVTALKRSEIEEHPDDNILSSPKKNVVLLVGGDPMVATTHSDLVLRAKKLGIKTKIIHASSIYSAVAETGLQIYKFGRTASIPYPEGKYFPTSPYDILKENQKTGAHTLMLLDVRAEEGRYMTVPEAIELLLRMEETRKERVFTADTLCVGVARLGGDSLIRAGKAKEMKKIDFGAPPHALIIPGKLHFMEEEMLNSFADD